MGIPADKGILRTAGAYPLGETSLRGYDSKRQYG